VFSVTVSQDTSCADQESNTVPPVYNAAKRGVLLWRRQRNESGVSIADTNDVQALHS
jgi:hypothetical protein